MDSTDWADLRLRDVEINVKAKLAALWATAMFCYIYADILSFYSDWLMSEILKGNMGPLGPITEELKLGIAVLMSIPALMVAFSLTLKAKLNRWANILAGSLMTIVILATLIMGFFTGFSAYYVYFAAIEIPTTSYIVWCAWKWPLQHS